MSRLEPKIFGAALAWGALAWTSALPARAVDHDNVDAGRPLDFDDAETIAFREKAFEFGGALFKPQTGKTGLGGGAEFLYGFAKNWHLNAGFDPQFGSNGRSRRRLDLGDLGLTVQHNFNRETESSPAFGFRADANLPTGRGSRGVDGRLRGIVSRKFGAYGRLHLNADLGLNSRSQTGQRKTLPGVLLGYSVPLDFPRRFNRTLVSQIGYRANPQRGEGALLNVGVGLRQQINPRSVFDIGIKSDLAGSGQARERIRLVAGYATAF
jgi:hypothetical protein